MGEQWNPGTESIARFCISSTEPDQERQGGRRAGVGQVPCGTCGQGELRQIEWILAEQKILTRQDPSNNTTLSQQGFARTD